jgi:DNA polymerase-1
VAKNGKLDWVVRGGYNHQTMAKTLYIIDGHAHIYAAFYAPMSQKLSSPAGEPTKATYIFTSMLLRLLQSKKPDMLVVAMDSKEPSFRKEIYVRQCLMKCRCR